MPWNVLLMKKNVVKWILFVHLMNICAWMDIALKTMMNALNLNIMKFVVLEKQFVKMKKSFVLIQLVIALIQ